TLLQDLRLGFRSLMRKPGFTVAAIASLALGIGVSTAIFSVVNALWLRPLPFRDPDRLVHLWETDRKDGLSRGIASPAACLDWSQRAHSFEMMSAWRTWFYDLTDGPEPEQVWGVRASAKFFDLLGVRAALGRTFLPGEDQAGGDQVVVLSHGL